jgi:plasmid stabilization system protein ParE
MNYRILLTARAAAELEEIARWWATHRSAAQAERWYAGFIHSIRSLQRAPDRCSLAHERSRFPIEIRQLAYGLGRSRTHRAVFTIKDDSVVVLTIRHLAQRELAPDDLL